MIIVAGHIVVDPPERGSYLASCVPIVEKARATPGCLDFSITADTTEEGRIAIFERWESREALETFRGTGPGDDQSAAIMEAAVAEYEIGAVRQL
ncbi:antibiotic biosynthesis monooxygenase [Saccharomonospora sp. NPDC006951]